MSANPIRFCALVSVGFVVGLSINLRHIEPSSKVRLPLGSLSQSGDRVRFTKNVKHRGRKFLNNELQIVVGIDGGKIIFDRGASVRNGATLHVDQGIAWVYAPTKVGIVRISTDCSGCVRNCSRAMR